MHVTWNLMARHLPRDANPLWWVLLAHGVLLAPWGWWSLFNHAHWDAGLLALLLVPATANTVYFIGLARAYEHAPVALVYPLVRSSPLLIALWGSAFLGQTLPAIAWLGIGISVVGLWVMASSARQGADRQALPWAVLAMLATSVYSLSDKAATQHIPDFMGLVGFISVGYASAWAALTWRMFKHQRLWVPAHRIGWLPMLVGGLCIGLAYALVIHAMRSLTAAEAVSFTNAGIVLATALSMLVFKETQHWRMRAFGVGVIVCGLLVLAAREGVQNARGDGH
jgi:phosphonate utilization associated putative membrane protein